MTRKTTTKTLPIAALAIVSLVHTSCVENIERGTKAFMSELEPKESVTVTSSIDLDQDIPSLPAPQSTPFSTSHPTSSVPGATSNDYQNGFRAGFTAGFQEGSKVREQFTVPPTTAIVPAPTTRIPAPPVNTPITPTRAPLTTSIPSLPPTTVVPDHHSHGGSSHSHGGSSHSHPHPHDQPSHTQSSNVLNYQKLIAKGAPWTWIWQYTGDPLSKSADIHVLDGFDHSVDDFRSLTEKGSFPVAYFSCSYESWRPDASQWRSSDKGKKMSGWDELWPAPSAIRDHNSNLWRVYEGRLDTFKEKISSITTEPWCFAIEWDNVDLYSSISLGHTEGLRFLRKLKQITEQRGFVFALKNSTEMIDDLKGVQMYINEEAQQWNELHTYSQVGRHVPVLNVEYRRPKQFPSYAYTIYYQSISNINGNAITYDSKY